MRALAAALLLIPTLAAAEQPRDFGYGIPLRTGGQEALQQLELPRAVYEGVVHADLSDLRVFNGSGEVVAHAFRPRVTTSKATPRALPLALYPIRTDAATGVEGVELRVEPRGNRTAVDVRTREGRPARSAKLVGYLADARALEQPIQAVTLEVPAGAAQVFTRVTVEASDDLRQWTPLARGAPVAKLASGGSRLEQLRIDVPARKAKYLRLSWPGRSEPLELTGLAVEPGDAAVAAPRQWKSVAGAPGQEGPGDWEFDLGGLFSVDRLRVALPQPNTVASVELRARAKAGEAWRHVTTATVYRLARDGDELTSADVEVNATADRFWLARVDQRGGGIGAGRPELTAGWVPHRLVSPRAAPGRSSSLTAAAPRSRRPFGSRPSSRATRTKKSSRPVSSSEPPRRRAIPGRSAATPSRASASTGSAGPSGPASCSASPCSAGWRSDWDARCPGRRSAARLAPGAHGSARTKSSRTSSASPSMTWRETWWHSWCDSRGAQPRRRSKARSGWLGPGHGARRVGGSGKILAMSDIRDCLPPDRHPRRPGLALPRGSIDTHVHVFEPGYVLSPGRGYHPPFSTLGDLKHLHATLGIDRVVFTQPSVYGTDNAAILDAMAALNGQTPGRARAVVALDMREATESRLAALDASGVRGVRLNTDNTGGMPIGVDEIPELAARLRPFGWHLEFLFPGKDIVDLMPVFDALSVPMSIAHFAYQPATAGVGAPGFRALVELVRRGNTWIKISGANRVSATDLPPYDDVRPLARALIDAAPERIMWGTDWPHPNKYVVNPNDADLVDAFGDWVGNETTRRKIMVETPAAFYRF